MDYGKELDLLIRARYPIIYVRTAEERRACNLFVNIAKAQKKNLAEWSSTEGLRILENFHNITEAVTEETKQPLAALEIILQDTGRTIYMMKDLHAYLEDKLVLRKLRDLHENLKRSYKTLVIISPVKKIPPEVEESVYFINMPPPDAEMLKALLKEIAQSLKADERIQIDLPEDRYDSLANAALGLTLEEAERVYFKSIIRDARLSIEDIQYIRDEKQQLVQKSGLLEYYETDENLDSVGGLDLLKAWLKRRARIFQPGAREYGLPPPKGLLLLGVQGCGKSLAAKAIAGSWGFPLLRLDLSRIFGSLIGSSEENMRRALDMAEAVSPVVLWVDEIEKTFSGIESSGITDAGTTARVFATFLTWMQDKKALVFVVATANSIARLPPELLRKGRFDDIFFVDLPKADERKDIFKIHLTKRKRNPDNFHVQLLATQSDGFSGAEIEQAIISAMFDAFDQNREVTNVEILNTMKSSIPLSVTMKEDLDRLREWAHERARPASS